MKVDRFVGITTVPTACTIEVIVLAKTSEDTAFQLVECLLNCAVWNTAISAVIL